MNDYLTSKELFLREHTGKERYEYFICTIAGVLFAYIAQTYTPHKLDSWFYWLTPFALLFLTLSLASGLARIFIGNEFTRFNKDAMHNFEDCVEISKELDKNLTLYRDHAGTPFTRGDLEKKRAEKIELIKVLEAMMLTRVKAARKLLIARDVSLSLAFLLILTSKILQPYQ